MIFTPKTGSFEGMKSMNRATILNMVRLEGPISRAQIAKRTKLTPPTVGTIVQELMEEDLLIEETGIGKIQGGRKPLMLSIHSSAFYAIGVYAAAEVVHTVIATLDGEIFMEKEERMQTPPPLEEFLQLLSRSVSFVIEESGAAPEKIIGIGVAMHGLVNSEEGTAIFSPHLQLENIPIQQHLEEKFSIPVLVENDVRTLTLAEGWYGEGQNISHFLCVSVGLGIGSGIVLDNTIYRGPVHSAGEIGHTVVDVSGPKCHCGNYGCLEAYASESSILEQTQRQLRFGKPSLLHEIAGDKELTMQHVYQAVAEKDPLAMEVAADAGRYLGIAIANITNMLSFSKIVLEGELFQVGDVILDPLRSMVEKRTLRSVRNATTIAISPLGKKGMVIGAFTLVIDQMFQAGTRQETKYKKSSSSLSS
ncbi:Sugar kinase of the NBD/HSP70 family, may contain an N-terminal HTH domain [Alkalicoccus daliensis]|uniref:Sugar kinase of the NBD/HSP70 family, may contain an N-terminal HTH domain n=2 Tax=Alkalicoccus daliensis TaxID=745820 RepID=A0A1H0F3S7_9BACI|nr:Sugar kinase of the NBD/HSP70 family, may contain an N-terminal HTH domain [Alkalicoccus daliensis]